MRPLTKKDPDWNIIIYIFDVFVFIPFQDEIKPQTKKRKRLTVNVDDESD